MKERADYFSFKKLFHLPFFSKKKKEKEDEAVKQAKEDHFENYDIDGVSQDPSGKVIVATDGQSFSYKEKLN